MNNNVVINDEALEARLQDKADNRMHDFERLARGEVTAKELQQENSIFPQDFFDGLVIENHFEAVGR